MTHIWVMAHYQAYEGHSPPVQAFPDFASAKAALDIANSTGEGGMRIFQVPMWPHTEGKPHYNIEAWSEPTARNPFADTATQK